ncbi:MAG TPA: hypothetical protein VEV43_02380 [Actinomycetota bacterium]|nr:hypothetical protein [Actinomycetota bacterium]
MKKRLMALGAASAMLLVFMAGPAHADLADNTWGPFARSTTGASVSNCWLYSWKGNVHDQYGRVECNLKDTMADGDAVYVEWVQDGYAAISLYNHGGNGTTKFVADTRYNGDGSFGTLKFRVCRDQGFPSSDNCSDWVIRHP